MHCSSPPLFFSSRVGCAFRSLVVLPAPFRPNTGIFHNSMSFPLGGMLPSIRTGSYPPFSLSENSNVLNCTFFAPSFPLLPFPPQNVKSCSPTPQFDPSLPYSTEWILSQSSTPFFSCPTMLTGLCTELFCFERPTSDVLLVESVQQPEFS